MPSEVRERPLPTPHPDYSRSPGSAREGGRTDPLTPDHTQESDPDASIYDSNPDDLDLMLSESISEPDPALASIEAFGARNRLSGNDVTISPFVQQNKDQPGTAEVFDAVGSGSDEIVPERAGWGSWLFSRLASGRARSRSGELRTAVEDDLDTRGLGMWTSLFLLSYASALTIGLIWMFWTGRTFRSAPLKETGTIRPAVDHAAKSSEPAPREDLPPIPAENLTSLGKTIRIGDVEITPLAIQLAPVDLVHRIDSAEFHHEETNSLILRFRLTNLSNVDTLKPLAHSLVRDHPSVLDRSFVAMPDGGIIGLYSLAVESEWLILGQEFPNLQPGESAETLVASEPVTEDRLRESMTWRVRLRIGPYRTDVLGVRFTKGELSQ